jgi:hypothetical protein
MLFECVLPVFSKILPRIEEGDFQFRKNAAYVFMNEMMSTNVCRAVFSWSFPVRKDVIARAEE